MKRYMKTLIITSLVIIVPIIAGLVMWQQLPEQLPTHFDSSGAIDGYSSKAFAVIGIPAFLLLVHLLCFFASFADPKRKGYGKVMHSLVLWICPAISLLCGFVMYSAVLGFGFNVGLIMSLFTGILIVIIGNYLPKCKRNYTIGIKLPWTMNSDENWNSTHRIAGFLWVIGGLVIVATSVFVKIWILFTVIITITIIPSIYSYIYYLKKEKHPLG